ncbi:MAG: aminodeoxychorismate synthase component I [Bacteroides sp.]|nr:aminodeoxychorismate synthase component I [Bacteroides sp.]
MKLYSENEAIERMNRLCAEKKPFIFFISYDKTQTYIEEIDDVNSAEVWYNFCGKTNKADTESENIKKIEWKVYTESFSNYTKAFEVIHRNIMYGNSFLTNLTRKTKVSTNLTLEQIFLHSKAPYRLYVKDKFCVFSPEIFVRINKGIIRSYPMKGTISADINNAVDTIMKDEKEMAEHATIVDLIRNDIGMVANNIEVTKYRYIDKIVTNKGAVYQTSSEISGEIDLKLKDKLGSVLFRLLPAGSITGAPKKKTMEIIAEAEGYERGFYTGVMGIFDGENTDSAVMIRFIENIEGEKVYKSGGGITCNSDPQKEYEEVIDKIYVPIC